MTIPMINNDNVSKSVRSNSKLKKLVNSDKTTPISTNVQIKSHLYIYFSLLVPQHILVDWYRINPALSPLLHLFA